MAKEKRVSFTVPGTDLNEGKKEYEVFYINGKRVQVRKDAEVEVKPIIKELYNENKTRMRNTLHKNRQLVRKGM